MLRLWFVLWFVVSTDSWSSATPGAGHICGYQVSAHSPEKVIARIVAAAFDDPNFGFQFPTLASFSMRPFANSEAESLFLSVQDAVVRTGAARFSDGTLRSIEVDWIPKGMIQDVAVTPAEFDGLHGRLRAPLSLAIDGDGVIRIFFSERTLLANRLVREKVNQPKRVATQDGYHQYELPRVRSVPFRSVDAKEVRPGVIRVFGLTDTHLHSQDIDLNAPNFTALSHEWTTAVPYQGGRFARAFSPDSVAIATDSGKVDLIESGSVTHVHSFDHWLVSLSAYEVAPGERRIAVLLYSAAGEPEIYLWSGKRFDLLPVVFPNEEKPVALSCSGMRPDSLARWQDWKNRQEMRTGHLAEAMGEELRRIVVLTRQGLNYQFRGIQGLASGQHRLSGFPWYYIGSGYSRLEKTLAQAGFDVKTLRQEIGIDTGIGEFGQKLARRLELDHGFTHFDYENPQNYKGDPKKIVEAWVRRLASIRDLRLVRSRVSGSISDEGIKLNRDQLLVYELMAIDVILEEGLADFEVEIEPPPTDSEWLQRFQSRLTDRASVLVQHANTHADLLSAYHSRVLKGAQWEDFVAPDRVLYEEDLPELARILYGISQHYLGKPYKYVVEDFLQFNKLYGSDHDRAPLWEVLTEFLDSVDPLRKVTNDQAFLRFLAR